MGILVGVVGLLFILNGGYVFTRIESAIHEQLAFGCLGIGFILIALGVVITHVAGIRREAQYASALLERMEGVATGRSVPREPPTTPRQPRKYPAED